MFDTCVFDLYGTLVHIHTDEGAARVWQAMARYYRARGAQWTGLQLKKRYFTLIAQMEAASDAIYPEIRIEEVFAALFEEKGVSADAGMALQAARKLRALSTDALSLYPGAWDLLDSLRAAGKRVILLSNAQRAFTQGELELLSLKRRFDAIFLSSDYGVRKPDPRFFEIMLEKAGVCPARAVMIGNDAQCDVLAAQACGMTGVYMHSACSPEEDAPDCALALAQVDLARVKEFLLFGKKDGE